MELGYCSHCHRLVHLIVRADGAEICDRCGRAQPPNITTEEIRQILRRISFHEKAGGVEQ